MRNSTDCIRGKVGYTKGIHFWEFEWNIDQRGTHAVVGVATSSAPLFAKGYKCLVGSSSQSWGFDLERHKVYFNSKDNNGKSYPDIPGESFTVPNKFLSKYNCEQPIHFNIFYLKSKRVKISTNLN